MSRVPGGPRASITGVFFLNGACFAAWYARIPAIQQDLDLSPGELGLALFGAPVGLLVAQPLAGALAVRHGSRPLVGGAPAGGGGGGPPRSAGGAAPPPRRCT